MRIRLLLILLFMILPRIGLGQETNEAYYLNNDRPFRNLFTVSEINPEFKKIRLSLNSTLSQADTLKTKSASKEKSINYKLLIAQMHLAIGVQNSIRLLEAKTRNELDGPFFRDWFNSVNQLHGWGDGDSPFINFFRHPLQGSASAFIFAQNHSQSKHTRFGDNGYWNTKTKQFIFIIIYSEYFELGPISEASIGNIGLRPGPHGYIDHVTTPVLGILLSIGEDIVDKYIIDRVRKENRCLGDLLSFFLNPGRTSANFMAFHRPGYRTFDYPRH